ncbi:MAG: sensor domain-containing protein [Mycobacterium sp.]
MNPSALRSPVTAIAVIGVLVAVGGCTRSVQEATPRPAPVAAPISELQVADLLSPQVAGEDGNLFVTAEPERCSGLAQEVDPPFLDSHRPLATDGGHWTTDDASVFVEEMVAVYRFDSDPAAALDEVRQTVEDCRDTPLTVTTMTMQGRTYVFEVRAAAADSPQSSVLWSLRAADWNCDNTFVAAHNAAVEITTCGSVGGFDVAGLAVEALERINALANTTA